MLPGRPQGFLLLLFDSGGIWEDLFALCRGCTQIRHCVLVVQEVLGGQWEGEGLGFSLLITSPHLSLQLEALNQSINIEQSQSDRSKRPFNPVT